jgi:hypothetical protein
MKRPDLDTLACVNAECQLFRRAGARPLVIQKVYGQDRIRLLRYRSCGEEFSERRGSALWNTLLTEAKAEEVINHFDEDCSVRATARLVHVATETRGAPVPQHWSALGLLFPSGDSFFHRPKVSWLKGR